MAKSKKPVNKASKFQKIEIKVYNWELNKIADILEQNELSFQQWITEAIRDKMMKDDIKSRLMSVSHLFRSE